MDLNRCGGIKADLVHAVEERPVRLHEAGTQAEVHQVNAAELHTSEGGNLLLNAVQQISHQH